MYPETATAMGSPKGAVRITSTDSPGMNPISRSFKDNSKSVKLSIRANLPVSSWDRVVESAATVI
jgi:hypothetical protein